MAHSLTEIAQQLKNSDKKIQLIYAFNGTGKTRLSREFKHLIAPKNENNDEDIEQTESVRKKIIYYNAFTEDLFFWDNDLELDATPKLNIRPNSFTQWILKDQGQDQNIISTFQQYTNIKLTPRFDNDFSEISFSIQRGNNDLAENIKISKGEESNFIWSFFYCLIEQVINVRNIPEATERETNQFDQLKYIFIDDPVSSLDENHLIALAVNLGILIKSSESDLKFIISTHNPLFYNVLYNEVKAKNGYILQHYEDGTFQLDKKQGDSNKTFSYHLYIKQLIEQAIKQNEVQRYHFVLLRNLYEKTANFLGYQNWSDLLPGEKQAYSKRIMNFYSHRTLSHEEVADPTEPEKQMVKYLLNNLINNYGFWQQGEQNG